MNEDDLIPIDWITDSGEPFQAEDLIEMIKLYPKFRIRAVALADKLAWITGKAEGDVNRITIVPARDEIVFYSDFGNFGDIE